MDKIKLFTIILLIILIFCYNPNNKAAIITKSYSLYNNCPNYTNYFDTDKPVSYNFIPTVKHM